jgi:hypothetical protein
VPYAPELHLRFTLLLEDVADRDAGPDEPVDWAIESALRSVVGRSLTDRLGPVHNVSFSSQVQYHSPLAVVPFPAVAGRRGWTVGADDVKAFVNSEEWTLGAEGAAGAVGLGEPARTELDLMVFVPKASRRPLALEIEGSGAFCQMAARSHPAPIPSSSLPNSLTRLTLLIVRPSSRGRLRLPHPAGRLRRHLQPTRRPAR